MIAATGTALAVLTRAGVIRPYGPLTFAALGRTLLRWGTGPAGGFATAAQRMPRQTGLIDDLGSLTFGELHSRSNALARGLVARGIGEGDSVALMCRNHRGFVDAVIAVSKVGADVLLLNTAFAGPQLVEVLDREQPQLVIHDQEFIDLLADADVPQRLVSWVDDPATAGTTTEAVIDGHEDHDLRPPKHRSRIVILTSGTTGTPKGAPRSEAGIDAAVAMLSRIPLRYGWRTHIPAPMFHTWGLAHFLLGTLLGSTLVLRRRFDPQSCLDAVERDECDSLVVVPVMLQRILALPDEMLADYSLPTLKVVAASGSALPPQLAQTWMDRFGENLYNLYGSTEVAYASIATPEDLRAAPTTAGRPPYGTTVRILDAAGQQVPDGETGRIFVGNGMLFEGYTGGGGKEVVDGLMSTGDLGRFGGDGRLYVDGRDDDMIVSGGENVFPLEVEDCLAGHPAVHEAAAVGVPDDDFGMRLRAFVVLDSGADTDLEAELKEWVRDRLARYKVPREVHVIDELPRNATGKVVKARLLEIE